MASWNCDECKKFYLNDDGTIQTVGDIPTKRNAPPICDDCEKVDFQNGWEYGNDELFHLYLFCTKFNTLPRAGGIEDQPTEIIEPFMLLSQIEDGIQKGESLSMQQSMIMASMARK